jgi:hypothetical protein
MKTIAVLFLICCDFRPDVQQAARALSEANIALYIVDPRALIGGLVFSNKSNAIEDSIRT